MNLHKPTATLFLDTRKAKETGKFPLKLTLYFRPHKKRYGVGIDLREEEWTKLNAPRLRDEHLKEIKLKCRAILTRAEKILSELRVFSFGAFESSFFARAAAEELDLSLQRWFEAYIQQLEQEGREGTRIAYQTTLNSLQAFRPQLSLPDITKEFLQKYEAHMTQLGRSPSTCGIYLRHLRSIVNRAIEQGALSPEQYPFKSFDIPCGRNVKKALDDRLLQKLLRYQPQTERQQKALEFWTLSYLCGGINFSDLLHLTPGNIHHDFLAYVREKTKRTRKRDLRPIKVFLCPQAKAIIERWQNHNATNPYLFPVLEAGLTPKTVKHRTQRFIKWVNKAMDEIRGDLGIEQKLGTYVARHCFSTRLMRQGVSTQFIKESLGHSSVAVTENYLGDFSDTVKREYANLLTDFTHA